MNPEGSKCRMVAIKMSLSLVKSGGDTSDCKLRSVDMEIQEMRCNLGMDLVS